MTNLVKDSVRMPHPWALWWLSLLIGGVALANLAQAWDQLRNAADYRALGVSYPPELSAMCALGWGLALLWLATGLFRRKERARRWILVIMSNYGAFGVLWLLAFARSDYSRSRIMFQAVLTAVLLLLLAWVMRWRRIRARFISG